MSAIKIVDLSKDEKPYDLEESGYILITGITESNLNDAITLAESALESDIVTIGIPAGNYDVKRFADVADAVIFTRNESDISRRIAEELSEIADDSAGFLNAGANVNAEFIDNNGRKSVLDVMFESAASAFSESEEVRTFLREVLPMMINAGTKINPAESVAVDHEYQDFRRNWENLLTEDYALANIANKNFVRRLISEAIKEYDTETVKGIIERISYTPLMYAAIFNKAEAVKFLIKNGADINARNIHNQNAAILAVTSDYNAWDSNVIRVLAEFGADIHDGLLSRAIDFANVDAVKVLLSLGAKLPGGNEANNPEPVTRNAKPCPKCGRIFSRGNDYCPSCGYVLPVSERYGK